jgi:hypothetical protein
MPSDVTEESRQSDRVRAFGVRTADAQRLVGKLALASTNGDRPDPSDCWFMPRRIAFRCVKTTRLTRHDEDGHCRPAGERVAPPAWPPRRQQSHYVGSPQ